MPRYITVGYAYPTSVYAERFKRAAGGCWFAATADAGECDMPGCEFGPFDSATAALDAALAKHPGLPILPADRDWIAERIGRETIDALPVDAAGFVLESTGPDRFKLSLKR